MKIEFSVLRQKEVVNISDGRKLGRICDCVIDTDEAKILGIILPGDKPYTLFKRVENVYIPWSNIKKFGSDVILVEVSDCLEKKHCEEN